MVDPQSIVRHQHKSCVTSRELLIVPGSDRVLLMTVHELFPGQPEGCSTDSTYAYVADADRASPGFLVAPSSVVTGDTTPPRL